MTATVGDRILFYPLSNARNVAFAPASSCAAIVAKVLANGHLNLAVFDGNGAAHAMENVPLLDDGDQVPANGYYAGFADRKVATPAPTPVKPAIVAATAPVPASPFSAANTPVAPPPVVPAAK
jgi:hypothetical protein